MHLCSFGFAQVVVVVIGVGVWVSGGVEAGGGRCKSWGKVCDQSSPSSYPFVSTLPDPSGFHLHAVDVQPM